MRRRELMLSSDGRHVRCGWGQVHNRLGTFTRPGCTVLAQGQEIKSAIDDNDHRIAFFTPHTPRTLK
jgi:hypothetical protein